MINLDDNILLNMLKEDCPFDDITTNGLGISEKPAQALLTARDEMVICGVEEAKRLFELAGAQVSTKTKSGKRLSAGETIMTVSGKAGSIHMAYKTAQTLMEILSGIATKAATIVNEAERKNPKCRVVCTRKHMPGMKQAALKAIMAGGAHPHRLGLSDFILVFAEHLNLCDPTQSLEEHIHKLKNHLPERKICVESHDIEQAFLFAKAGADIIQLDKIPPAEIHILRARIDKLPHPPLLSAAGGINAENAGLYAEAGADILVTSQPYYAPPKDVKVQIKACI